MLPELAISPAATEAAPRPQTAALAAAAAIAIFAALSAWAAVVSEGFLEADSCTHYLYARFALSEPHYLVNVWGRPICTAIYAVPAALAGPLGVRFTSLSLAVASSLIALAIARRQGARWPVLALIFTLGQPLVFLHSFSELTELPFAALVIAAFWAYQRRLFWLMAALVGLSPLGRPEGFGFIVLAAAALIAHRRWHWMVLLALPLVLWDYSGWVLYGRPGPWWGWLRDNWPYASESLYRSGHLWHFVVLMPAIVGPLGFPATVFGTWLKLRQGEAGSRNTILSRFVRDHSARCDMLIALLPLSILVGHSLLYWLGKMASNGEARYMLVVAPFWGLLTAAGWEWAFERLHWRRAVLWAGLAALFPVLLNHRLSAGPIPLGYKVIPLVLSEDWHRAREVAEWYNDPAIRERYPRLMASHPGIFYFLDQSPTARDVSAEWREATLKEAQPGTLLIWDSIYGVFNSDAARSITEQEIEAAGWVPLREFPASGNVRWRLYVSPAASPAGAGSRGPT